VEQIVAGGVGFNSNPAGAGASQADTVKWLTRTGQAGTE